MYIYIHIIHIYTYTYIYCVYIYTHPLPGLVRDGILRPPVPITQATSGLMFHQVVNPDMITGNSLRWEITAALYLTEPDQSRDGDEGLNICNY